METQPNNELITAKIRIVEIKDQEWHMSDITNLVLEKDFRKFIAIQFSGGNHIIPEKERLVITLAVRFLWTKEGSDIILSYVNSTTFQIVNFKDVVSKSTEENYTLPSEVMDMLLATALSTVRGILVEKLANTEMRGMYIPMMHTEDLSKTIFN